jgi:hypothetical protein
MNLVHGGIMIRATLLGLLTLAQIPAVAQTPIWDYWSGQVTLRTTDSSGAQTYFAPIHATVLPDGRVALMGYSKPDPLTVGSGTPVAGVFTPSPWSQIPPPVSVSVPRGNNALDVEYYEDGRYVVRDSLFCSGHSLLPDGRLLTVGGTRYVIDKQSAITYLLGLPYSVVFDGTAWRRGPDHTGRAQLDYPYRWYSTATRLASGRVLATSGYDLAEAIYGGQIIPGSQLRNRSVESYDPITDTWTVLSSHAASPPEIFNYDYSHVFQLPFDVETEKDVLVLGNPGVPVLFSPTDEPRWTVRTGSPRPGAGGDSGHGASSALLPIRLADGEWGYSNGSVLLAGGRHDTDYEHGVDVYDPRANAWLQRSELGVRRHHPMTVLLPDARLLVLAGHDDADPENPEVRHVQLIDTLKGRAVYRGVAEIAERRGYHAVSVLLPDGRVLVAGGRDGGTDSPEQEKPTLRYYYPWYFAYWNYRPRIAAAPAVISYGATFTVEYTSSFPVTEAALVGLGAMTHSFDANQRHIQLAVQVGSGSVIVTGPPDDKVAPPGHYMLVLLDQYRIPSEARIVKLE